MLIIWYCLRIPEINLRSGYWADNYKCLI
jgi:hypothetical protein